ncbi:MAG: C-GCAxxG-C-C family protein [Bacillota bacterium]|nr:C-GCAxxG-C-C family protein [Bacillota bacterium]
MRDNPKLLSLGNAFKAIEKELKAREADIIKEASEQCMAYKLKGFHCSESSIRACSEALGLRLSEDVLRTASGFRGGGGGYYDRCGILEAGCMIVSYLYGRLTPQQQIWDYSYLIRVLHERFEEEFGTIYCRDIIKKELEEGAVPVCMSTYERGAAVVVRLILDAPDLIANIPEEEKDR